MSPAERIGTKIRRARERLHLSQDDLAAKLGVSRSAVNAWENERTYPKNRIGALEAVLGIDLTGEPASDTAPEYDDPALQHIWETPGLPEDVRRGLVALAIGWRTQARSRRAS